MRIRRFLVAGSAAVVGIVGLAADGAHATGVPNHNHFLTTGSGSVVQVGPHVCDSPELLHDAFHNFHGNVHTGAPTQTGGVSITAVLC